MRMQATSRQKPQEAQQAPITSQAGTATNHPRLKRRKHEGIRYGPPPTETQHALTDRKLDTVAENRPSTNHYQVERAKAEAQLHGRRFQMDTSSCVLPNQDQLFTSQPWSLPQMMVEKDKLNATKDQLDSKDIK